MITALVGENSFAVKEALAEIIAGFSGTPERYDGDQVTLEQFAGLVGGALLFADTRLVIIRDLSHNSELWSRLPDWIEGVADETHLVLIDEKPDKRTVSYKALKTAGAIREFPAWTDRDRHAAQSWVSARAKQQGLSLTPELARHVVDRVGVDQWQLASAIDKLLLLDRVDTQAIDEHVEVHPTENIFQLFETAIEGSPTRLRQLVDTLRLSEDAYAVFALLSSQVVQMAAVIHAPASADPAKEFGIHPFVVSKLRRAGGKLGPAGVSRMVAAYAKADVELKTSATDPWPIVESLLARMRP